MVKVFLRSVQEDHTDEMPSLIFSENNLKNLGMSFASTLGVKPLKLAQLVG